METQQAFVDTSKREIKKQYDKDENNFNVTVNRMLKALGDPSIKYKKDNEIWIKAVGVEWLHNHWVKPVDLKNNPELYMMQVEAKHQEEIINQLKEQIKTMKLLYQEKLQTELEKQQLQITLQTNAKLLEFQDTAKELEEAKAEIERLKNRSLLDRILNK